jgi:hypothetical protein
MFRSKLRPVGASPDANGIEDLIKQFSPSFPSTVAFQIAGPAPKTPFIEPVPEQRPASDSRE